MHVVISAAIDLNILCITSTGLTHDMYHMFIDVLVEINDCEKNESWTSIVVNPRSYILSVYSLFGTRRIFKLDCVHG